MRALYRKFRDQQLRDAALDSIVGEAAAKAEITALNATLDAIQLQVSVRK